MTVMQARLARMETSKQDPQFGNNQAERSGWERFLPERPLRVLLVEDDNSTRQIVCTLLSKCGYEVSPTTDGLKAWELLEQSEHKFDLILADAMMPVLSGTDLLSKVVESEAYADIPVIMMSSQDSMDVVFKCLLRGAKDFLVKPLRKNELRNLWQHVWRKNHLSSNKFGSGVSADQKRRKVVGTSGRISSLSYVSTSLSSDINGRACTIGGNSAQGLLEQQGNSSAGGSCADQASSKELCLVGGVAQKESEYSTLPQRTDALSNPEGSESLERSDKAMNLIGTMMSNPGLWKPDCNHGGRMLEESAVIQPPLALELSLKRTVSARVAWSGSDSMQGVRQSLGSAFSSYSSVTGSDQHYPQCMNRTASFPEQSCFASGRDGTFAISEGAQSVCANSAKLTEKPDQAGSCGSSTLHFPRAMRVGRSGHEACSRRSLLSFFSPDGRHTSNEDLPNSSHSMNLPTTDAILPPTLGCNHRNDICVVPKCTSSSPGQVAVSNESTKQPGLVEMQGCNFGDDLLGNQGQLTGCSTLCSVSSEAARLEPCLEHEYHFQAAEDTGGEQKGENECDTAVQPSTTGSGTDYQEICLYAKNQTKDTESPAHDRSSLEANTEMNSTIGSHGLPTFEPGNAHCYTTSPYGCWSTFREAALHKFRQKRKIRCFEKKVRYQSRKQLAEQRPRVKGQFVRRAVYDASLANHTQ